MNFFSPQIYSYNNYHELPDNNYQMPRKESGHSANL